MAPAPTRTYTLVDATDAYFAFWDRHEHDPVDAQIDAFLTEVVAAHPELYAPSVIGLPKDQPQEEALRARLRAHLPRVQPLLGAMRGARRDLDANLGRYEASFLEAFDDFRYDGRVYITDSAGGFDGATRAVEGREALLFGVDGIALHHPPGSDLGPFFHHELFHLYHQQMFEEQAAEMTRTIAMALWAEGLAVYVSERLNEGATFDDLLLTSEMVEQTDARLPELAADLAAHLNSGDRRIYASYFLGADGGRVPKRCGYYIGLLVARRVGEGRTLKGLARLHGAPLVEEIAAALTELGVEGPGARAAQRPSEPERDVSIL